MIYISISIYHLVRANITVARDDYVYYYYELGLCCVYERIILQFQMFALSAAIWVKLLQCLFAS